MLGREKGQLPRGGTRAPLEPGGGASSVVPRDAAVLRGGCGTAGGWRWRRARGEAGCCPERSAEKGAEMMPLGLFQGFPLKSVCGCS